ncbi:MAG: divergent polysaccharide deacetylase family protein [Sneathiella sp.]|uniref:divergent polysaccharide deacetylase family protein n=1 Tax=Sneathiella sp. TaxID=1964365 RepID=UPI0030039FDB
MFVFSIALMLAVIGSSAWVYLDHDGDFSPEVVSAVAAIDAPLVVFDPIISAHEKTTPTDQEKRVVAEEKTDVAVKETVASATVTASPAPAAEPIDQITEAVPTAIVLDPQPPATKPAPLETPVITETKPEPTETTLARAIELVPLGTPKTPEIESQPTDTPKIAENVAAEEVTPEIVEAAPEQIKKPIQVSESVSTIPEKEMQEILAAEPAAGSPVVPEPITQPDMRVTDTLVTPANDDIPTELPTIAAAQDQVSKAPDEATVAAEDIDPIVAIPVEFDREIIVADIPPAPAPSLDVQKAAPAPKQPALPEIAEEIVVAPRDKTTEKLISETEETKVETPAWLEETPSLPARGAVEMALVLPPSQPSYAFIAPTIPEEKPVETAPKITSTPVEPVVLTLPPENKPLWQANAQPFEDAANRPRIAIIVSEMGISKAGTTAAIDQLPAAVTLAFNPYGRRLQSWIDKSRERGHEVLLQLPMEPMGYPKTDPGPRALLTSLTPVENLERLNWSLDRFSGYTGLTNQMGSKFTASRSHIEPVLAVLKEKGLLYVDSRTASNSVAAKIAKELSIPVALNNRFLDHRADVETLDARLVELENIALKTGSAIGIGYPYPATLERLATWTASLAEKGIVLAPISALVNRQDVK